MTAVADQIPLDALDDAEHRTPAWMSYRQQMGAAGDPGVNVMPKGTYTATLIEVTVVRRKDGGGFALRMIARTVGLSRFALAWRGLSSDPSDPYQLTEGELRGLRKFAASMGISTAPVPPQAIVSAILDLQGEQVDARVVHTPAGPQATFSRAVSAADSSSTSPVVVVDGRVVDRDGEAHDLQGAAATAHEAHKLVLKSIQTANQAVRFAAEGCYRLQASKGWVALGYETLSEYLAAPEITMTRTDFFRFADIWETYVVDGGVDPVLLAVAGPSKLEVPLPALKAGIVGAEQAVADAEAMPRNDLREHYKDLLGDQPRVVVEDEKLRTHRGLAQQALDLITERPGITIPEIAASLEVQQNGLYKVLPDLATEGLIIKDGRGWRPRTDDHPERGESPAGGIGDNEVDVAIADRAQLLQLRGQLDEANQRAEAWKADSVTHLESLKAHREMIEQLNADLVEAQAVKAIVSPEDVAELVEAAKGVTRTLKRILDEIGDPRQKRMGKELRFAVIAALEEAESHGLGES